MAYQYFLGFAVDGVSGRTNAVNAMEDAVDDAAQEMDSYSSQHSYATLFPNYNPSLNPGSRNETEWLTDLAQDIADSNKVTLVDGDVVIVLDGKWSFGYGLTVKNVTVNNVTINIGRAVDCYGVFVINEGHDDTKEIVKHNIGHCMDIGHAAGTYDDNGNSETSNVTPLARAYVKGQGGNTDTCFGGNGNYPSQFCGNMSNDRSIPFCADGNCGGSCRSQLSYSSCAKSQIESNTPI